MKNASLILPLLFCVTSSWSQISPRVENTSLNMPAEMFSSVVYELENINPGEIGHPMALVSPLRDDRLFVVDRLGIVRVIDGLNSPSPSVFLDISDRVESDFLEEGLLGLTFQSKFTILD